LLVTVTIGLSGWHRGILIEYGEKHTAKLQFCETNGDKKGKRENLYLLKIAFSATLLSPLNSTSCPPRFKRNRELMFPFKVT
jgi:hypothetical protein